MSSKHGGIASIISALGISSLCVGLGNFVLSSLVGRGSLEQRKAQNDFVSFSIFRQLFDDMLVLFPGLKENIPQISLL